MISNSGSFDTPLPILKSPLSSSPSVALAGPLLPCLALEVVGSLDSLS